MANTIIFKVKPEFRSACQDKVIKSFKANNVFSAIGVYNVHTKFPGKTPPAARINKYGEKLVDLSLIYECKYSSAIPLESAINKLYASGMFEYVQPHYLPHLLYVPNDPYADTTNHLTFVQWHLKTIHAYEAWGIQQGNPDIVIGIVDTGTDLSDSDLVHNIKINYADPIDGIDNDNDGYTDNYYGYDLADNNFSPQWDYYPNALHNIQHGVFTSGLASAVTDNDTAGAGVGFKCKFLPVKISDTNGVLTMAYEGIVYAAEHGCSIINCSWGGLGSAGQYGQDIVNYATNNMNALVIAACGDDNSSNTYYPAAYDNVLSVAATDIYDHKWINPTGGTGSTYGITVDISAPGYLVYSNVPGGFTASSGTSCAAPIVCGAAAIVKANYPNFSPIQIGEQLKVTADNIDTIPANFPYAGLLGAGRLNMFKALTINNLPSIVMTSNKMTDHNNMSFEGGDTINIYGEFENYLDTSSSSLGVTLSTSSPYANILDSTSVLGVINTLDSTNNNSNPFKVKILQSIPVSTEIDFKLTYSDQSRGYKAYQYFSIIVNVDYFNIDTNKVATTFTSKGMIGYNLPASYSQGVGFSYNNSPSLLNDGGLLIGTSASQVSDDIYGPSFGTYDTDFKTMKTAHRIIPPVVSDFDAETVFSDSSAVSPLGIIVTNKAYSWASAPKDKFIIMEYTIKNISTTTLSSLYAGLFMDFDISPGGAYDRIDFDAINKMSYTYSTLEVHIQLLNYFLQNRFTIMLLIKMGVTQVLWLNITKMAIPLAFQIGINIIPYIQVQTEILLALLQMAMMWLI